MLPNIKPSRKLIYLDHAATTPLDPRVKRVMEPFWSERFGNPSSLYKKGRDAAAALAGARAMIAGLIGARPEEVLFTAGGTESINLAIFGLIHALRRSEHQGVAEHVFFGRQEPGRPQPHCITTTVEHHAVLHPFEALEEEGLDVSYVETDGAGLVTVESIAAAVRNETVLISVMLANNEIGTIEPVAEIGKWLRGENERRTKQGLARIYFHTDACQAAGLLDIDVNRLGVDLLSANGSKMYGPKQTGFLYARSGTPLRQIIFGGGQERDLRSGTENVAGAAGLAEAFKLAQKNRLAEYKRLAGLQTYFIKQLQKKIPGVMVNGPELDPKHAAGSKKEKTQAVRLPNNVNVTIPDVEGEALMLYLDAYNIAAATGSACTASSPDPSRVLLAIGRSEREAKSSIRFTLGHSTTKADLEYVMKVLPGIALELKKVTKKNF